MGRFQNRAVVAQGMLAPSGYLDTAPDPVVQSTVRPYGTLLKSSPGYASIRQGKNRFQGRGPTGGFRPWQFAEDVGGTGAALAVIPGDTSLDEVTEWLPEDTDSMPEGAMIISDRTQSEGFATELHEAEAIIPDMGDRHPARPLSKSRWLVNPVGMFRADLRENPSMTILASLGFVGLVTYIANDLERQYRSRRGSSITTAATAAPAAAVATTGDAAEDSVKKVSDAADAAVDSIRSATNEAVDTIKSTANDAKQTVTGE